VGKPEGKRQLERRRYRWVVNIESGLREIGWDDMDLIDRDQDRTQPRAVVTTVMNLPVLRDVGKFLSGCRTDGF
jgi:hypothetical protein